MNLQKLINLRVLSICIALLFAQASLWAHWRGNVVVTRITLLLFSLFVLLALISLFIRPGKP